MSSSLSAEYLAEDRGPTIIANNASITAIAAIIVIARITTRFGVLKKLGLDDWTIILATILAVGNIVLASQSVRLGTGRHKQAIPHNNAIPAGIYRFATRVIYFLITGTIKLSVCFLYLRVFPTLRTPTLLLTAFIICCTIAQEFATIFQCVPVAGVWNTTKYPDARCIDNVAFSYSASALSVFTDMWTLVLPLPTVWALQIPTRKKMVLTFLFSLGMFACIAGIIRMVYLITLLTSTDQPWDTYSTSIASGWETALAIITASVPGLKPAFDRLFPRLFPMTRSGSKATGAGGLGYEMGTTTKSRIGGARSKGFEMMGSGDERRIGRAMGGEGDGDSTTAISERGIKVNYEYHVRSEDKSDAES
ncbi:hypothetical protein BDZ45DRAFT_697162 [Acephala macrosclerotiorum]|nr:hypothetical protein BDZ45DRAFT_697162 [Acephala macrosclerotiorum]